MAALFSDESAQLAHTSRPSAVDDFAAQPTLSRRWSTAGPGIWWTDLDGDDQDELLVVEGAASARQRIGDAWREVPRPAAGWGGLRLPAGVTARGPFALGDVDGDGAPDLFAAAPPAPGRYPEAPAPRCFRATAGEFREVPAWAAALREVGLVNDALLTDLTGDLRPELVLACEWGPLRIFRFAGEGWVPWNPALTSPEGAGFKPQTLNEASGWWTGLASGDFDGNGRLDLVAGNWGRNTRFEEVLAHPVRLHFADFDGDGVIELLETVFDPAQEKEIVWRDHETLTRAMPLLAERAPTFAALGQTDLGELLGDRRAAVRTFAVNTAETVLLLNRGDHLERRPLPVEAQFAPAFGLAVADFDGDGHEDLFLAQNFFGVELESPRYDAGRGLLLLGDGRGGFRALSAAESGLALYGEGRGAAVADFDRDGRVDLAVGQPGGATQLYRNRAARPGVRVRLRGSPANPAGLGAQLRVLTEGRLGPVREIRAGGGWRSLDSTTLVLARPAAAAELEVRHRDGRRTVHPLAADVREVMVE